MIDGQTFNMHLLQYALWNSLYISNQTNQTYTQQRDNFKDFITVDKIANIFTYSKLNNTTKKQKTSTPSGMLRACIKHAWSGITFSVADQGDKLLERSSKVGTTE